MVERGWLRQGEARGIDLQNIAWFLNTDLGGRAVQAASDLRREVPFIAKVPPGDYDPGAAGAGPEDFILLRGMVDLLIPSPGGFEVVDFKTDRVSAAQVVQRMAVYQDQIRRYAMSIARIWRCAIHRGAVVFLEPRQIEYVDKLETPLHP
jgi:ATP-dependent exoDNAse (exonuclease V) beta subunit